MYTTNRVEAQGAGFERVRAKRFVQRLKSKRVLLWMLFVSLSRSAQSLLQTDLEACARHGKALPAWILYNSRQVSQSAQADVVAEEDRASISAQVGGPPPTQLRPAC
eukprot:TRINITY_DN23537_c0_g1_i1.p1 TRINITY_DN23537_c0_g1~~TRINITY_DN23537_c0_g1_i1.p1  ORF type:complete len:107 (-),score=10.21 TRINITY_DN23537_c0_g1_i1:111-431(-)